MIERALQTRRQGDVALTLSVEFALLADLSRPPLRRGRTLGGVTKPWVQEIPRLKRPAFVLSTAIERFVADFDHRTAA